MADVKAAGSLKHDVTILSKLTLKGMGCDPSKVKSLTDGNKLTLGRIYGIVNDVRYKEDRNKPGAYHTQFVGTLEGVNMETGEIFRSGICYFPAGISETMEAAFKQIAEVSKKDGTTPAAQFAFEIRSVKASNPIGYSYEAQAIRKPEQDDPLAELRAQLLALPTAGEVVTSGKKQLEGATAKK